MGRPPTTGFHRQHRMSSTNFPTYLVFLFDPCIGHFWSILCSSALFPLFVEISWLLSKPNNFYKLLSPLEVVSSPLVIMLNHGFLHYVDLVGYHSLRLSKVQLFLQSCLELLLLPYTNSLGMRIICHIMLNYGLLAMIVRIISLLQRHISQANVLPGGKLMLYCVISYVNLLMLKLYNISIPIKLATLMTFDDFTI